MHGNSLLPDLREIKQKVFLRRVNNYIVSFFAAIGGPSTADPSMQRRTQHGGNGAPKAKDAQLKAPIRSRVSELPTARTATASLLPCWFLRAAREQKCRMRVLTNKQKKTLEWWLTVPTITFYNPVLSRFDYIYTC